MSKGARGYMREGRHNGMERGETIESLHFVSIHATNRTIRPHEAFTVFRGGPSKHWVSAIRANLDPGAGEMRYLHFRQFFPHLARASLARSTADSRNGRFFAACNA